MSCPTLLTIADTECIGASLPKINGNFAALSAIACQLSTLVNTISSNMTTISSNMTNILNVPYARLTETQVNPDPDSRLVGTYYPALPKIKTVFFNTKNADANNFCTLHTGATADFVNNGTFDLLGGEYLLKTRLFEALGDNVTAGYAVCTPRQVRLTNFTTYPEVVFDWGPVLLIGSGDTDYYQPVILDARFTLPTTTRVGIEIVSNTALQQYADGTATRWINTGQPTVMQSIEIFKLA